MRKFIVSFVLALFVLYVVPTISKAQLADGIYSIQYQVNKPNDASASIANDYFAKPAKLLVENGAMKVQLTIKNSSWVTEFNGAHGGNVVMSENKDANTRVVQFTVAAIDKPTLVKMKVDIDDLNYHHEYSTDFVWNASSVQLLEAASKPAANAADEKAKAEAAAKAAEEKAKAEAAAKAADEKAKAEAAAKAAEEKAKAEAAAKAAEEKAKAEVAAKAAEEKAKAEAAAKAAEEKAKAEAAAKAAEEKDNETANEAQTDAEAQQTEQDEKEEALVQASNEESAQQQEAEENKQQAASATEQNKQVAAAEEQAVVANETEEKTSGLMWVFILAGLGIIGVATTIIMKKRTVE